jgi:hypothetical protein
MYFEVQIPSPALSILIDRKNSCNSTDKSEILNNGGP